MQSIAYAMVVMAGALMASAGAIAEALPDFRRSHLVDEAGLALVGLGVLMLVGDAYGRAFEKQQSGAFEQTLKKHERAERLREQGAGTRGADQPTT